MLGWNNEFFSVQVGGEVEAEVVLGLAPYSVEAADIRQLPLLPLSIKLDIKPKKRRATQSKLLNKHNFFKI
jgi:hypothetical protein